MLVEDKIFEKEDFSANHLPKGAYEYCKFINCSLDNTHLSSTRFLECAFINCNLSMATTGMTVFRDISFSNCKMLGLNFEHCSEFGFKVSFSGCILNHASFFRRKMKETLFKNCQLVETDFTETDLTGANFENCDLANAKFENSILEKADFRSSYHYSINPEINRLKNAKFDLAGLPGLLTKYNIEIF